MRSMNFAFSSRIKLMNIVLDTIEILLEKMGLDTEKHWKILLALREIVTNSVIHGNKERPEKMVKISIEYGEFINFTVKDEGQPFDFKAEEKIPKNILSTEGRGIFLATHIMDSVKYKFQNGNIIEMIKRL